MGIMSPTDLKPENSNPRSQNYQGPSEKLLERVHMYMKGGACKESVTAYLQDCKEETVKCTEAFSKMRMCMEAHSDYYQPCIAMRKSAEELFGRNLDAIFLAKDPKEGDKLLFEFMRGGACKEAFMSFRRRGVENTKNNNPLTLHKQHEAFETLCKCMKAHSNYYQPYLSAMNTSEEYYFKEFDAFLAARNL